MPKNIQTVPHQRVITVNKEPTDKEHIYTTNNIAAVDEAAFNLQSKAGFKLYMYLAKNQNKRQFALSSSAFMAWSGTAATAYTTAFKELVEKGYLIQKEGTETVFQFYDKSRNNLQSDKVIIEFPKDEEEKEQPFNF